MMKRLMPAGLIVSAVFASSLITSCGYSFQSTRSPALEKAGVERIYLAPVKNDTYKGGVESVVYNALIHSLVTFPGIRIVSDEKQADAILISRVNRADLAANGTKSAKSLQSVQYYSSNPNIPDLGDLLVATDYIALLDCSFTLNLRNPRPGALETLWTGSFSRSKVVPGANQVGALGTTSPLINDSEFDRALSDISQIMMLDVRESMLARF